MVEHTLDELVEGSRTEDDVARLSRRKFLTGAAAGGAAGLVVAAGTGVAVWNVADAQAQVSLEEAEAEIARLQGLVDLYEDMEKIGLDAILAAGMEAMALPLEAVELGAKALNSGLDWAEEALLSLEEALPTAEESILWLENQVSALADGIERLETALGQALEKATDNPIGEALQDFATMILDSLPFGLGDKIRAVLDQLVQLLTSVDELVEGINTLLLEPIREEWFSTEEGKGMGATLVTPLIENVLDPLEGHLSSLATLADTWQQELVAPTQHALQERDEIQKDIARYKDEHGFL
jgi:hypothetical protein